MTGAATPGGTMATDAPVSNALVDIAFACAAHAELTHSQREPAHTPEPHFTKIDDGMFVSGQLAPSAAVLEDVQVRRACHALRAAMRVRAR
jgi:hypothetical protein